MSWFHDRFAKVNNPTFQMKFHLAMMLFFIVLTIPAATLWANSVPFLVAISMWALIAAHWAAYQGAHGEKEQKEDNDVDFDDMDERVSRLAQRVEHLIALVEDKQPPEPERCL